MEQTESFAEPISKVERWFSVQAKHWYEWAISAAQQDLSNVLNLLKSPAAHEEGLKGEPKEFMILDEGKVTRVISREGKYMPSNLLQAMLAKFICNEVFTSPVWVMDAFVKANGKEEMDRGMMGLYEYSQHSEPYSEPR